MKTRTLIFMNRTTATLAVALTALALTGCYNPNGTPDNTGTGVLAGGAFGAATGALIGAAAHNPGAGAAIGAATGHMGVWVAAGIAAYIAISLVGGAWRKRPND